MPKALKYFIAAFLLLVALALIIPALIPAETYKTQVIAAVERSTGRTLTIDGDLSLQFRPGVEFSIEDVTLSNAPGATDDLMAQMARMTIGVDWRAFLSRRITITKFILEDPVISLEVMKNGTANWEFTTAAKEKDTGQETSSPPEALDAISFGDLRIVRGRLVWRNHSAGQTWDVSNVNLDIILPDLKGEARVAGDLTYNGEDLKLALILGSVEAITSGAETSFKIALDSRLMNAELDGSLTGGAASKIKARANVKVPSVRQLAAWTGAPVASEKGFGRFAIEGDLFTSGSLYSFTDATIAFDDMTGTGSLTIKNTGSKPIVSGRLTVNEIDLRSYMPEPVEAEEASGGTTELAWSKAPIDFSGLKALEVNFALKSSKLYFQDYEIGDTELNLSVRNNILTATLARMDLYGGTGTGTVSFDTNPAAARAKATFALSNINAGPLMLAASGKDIIEGTGEFSFGMDTAGKSQDALMRNLAGKGALTLRDGKLKGVNLNRMLQVLSAFTPQQKAASAETEATTAAETGTAKSTDFVEMGGTFDITSGVLRTSDFALVNDALSLAGQGRVDIGNQSIDMKLAPGKRQDDGGTNLKMKVQGPWNNIKYAPDFEDVIKGGLRDLILGDSKDKETSPEGEIANQLLDAIFGSGRK